MILHVIGLGVTEADYERMLEEQGGVCAICEQPETVIWKRSGKPKALSIDHNHTTGQVRALLCHACNSALGSFREDPELLTRAIDYLARYA
jgi:hypothetical protein